MVETLHFEVKIVEYREISSARRLACAVIVILEETLLSLALHKCTQRYYYGEQHT